MWVKFQKFARLATGVVTNLQGGSVRPAAKPVGLFFFQVSYAESGMQRFVM